MTKFSGNYSVYIGIDWITNIHKQYKGQIAVAVELSKGPIVYALQKLDFVTINPVNPSMLATYRRHFLLAEPKMFQRMPENGLKLEIDTLTMSRYMRHKLYVRQVDKPRFTL